MVAIAAVVKLGASLELATRAIILAAHAITAGIVFVSVRGICRAPAIAATASSFFLIFGPGAAYVSTYFGAPVFACCAAGACALAIMRGSTRRGVPATFAAFPLLTGLVRPEGVILVSLMLLSIVATAGFRAARRIVAGAAIPMIGFAMCFVLNSNWMNFAGRFQYAILPMALMAWPVALHKQRDGASKDTPPASRWFMPAALVCLLISVVVLRLWSADWKHFPDGRAEMGKALNVYEDRGLRLATSEAGLLPLYSEWKMLDTWRLNDFEIARRGTITRDRLAAFDPDLIVFHAINLLDSDGAEGLPGWDAMVDVLRACIDEHGFILAAKFGVAPNDAHYYYVHPRLLKTTDIMERISRVPNPWPGDGALATNIARSGVR